MKSWGFSRMHTQWIPGHFSFPRGLGTRLTLTHCHIIPKRLHPKKELHRQIHKCHFAEVSVETLLQPNPTLSPLGGVDSLPQEQHKDPALLEMIQFLRSGVLPTDAQPHKTALQSYGVPLVSKMHFYGRFINHTTTL